MDLTPVSMGDHEAAMPFSSQETIDIGKENIAPVSSPPRTIDSKPRRPPTVTPKRFTRFFTPRSSLQSRNTRASKSRQIFKEIPNHQSRPETDDFLSLRSPKRRRVSVEFSSPPQSSPIKYLQQTSSPLKQVSFHEDDYDFSDADSLPELPQVRPAPVRRLKYDTSSLQLLSRTFGQQRNLRPHTTTAESTADYCSTPNDVYAPRSSKVFMPYCTEACNTTSLVAIGTEEGEIHLLDTAGDFDKAHITFNAHCNAIMDMAFSSCDYILATASGDRSCHIIDMYTQKPVSLLSGHMSSVKQIRFRPGDDRLLTTSGRDGSINIWDLRCAEKAVQAIETASGHSGADQVSTQLTQYANMFVGPAHRARTASETAHKGLVYSAGTVRVSITSIEHLHGARSHLLLSGSEQNASLKLWDLRAAGRTTMSDRFRCEIPVASTSPPAQQGRNYGVSALRLSTDGSRAYSVCKDNIVWVYSTQHLMMGCMPAVSDRHTRYSAPTKTQEGLGPLYGLFHPDVAVNNFYVRAAVRKTSTEHEELLAIGSQDKCAVLMPTDESYLYSMRTRVNPREPRNACQVFTIGTRLDRGHTRDVTTMAFTNSGDLVTSSDDLTARCWRQDRAKARHLRQCGEGQGSRWRSGWAGVAADFDDDDE